MTLWLHFLHQTQPLCGGWLRAALEQAGFTVQPSSPADGGDCGVVVFRQIDTSLLDLLRQVRGCARVLAVALAPGPSPGPFSAAESWSVIDAGAADLLCWPQPARSAGIPSQHLDCLLARLRRWDAVDGLLRSPAVRSSVVGDSPAWSALVRSVVEVAAFTRATVLITGETGTGKDLLAQLIHKLGGGSGEPVVVDCTTLSPELSGSELFGHEKGAFTGASSARDGAFALADGGVLFLDEVGELPLLLQAQLLRAVQERQYKRIGSNTWQRADFRLVCATHRDLEAGIAAGLFRADLYYRIAGWRCRTPPLRERRGDILPLARHFLATLAPPGHRLRGGEGDDMDAAVREFLLTRDYPGNVRELRQTVTRLWHRHSGPGPLTLGDLPPDERPTACEREAAWPDRAFEDAIAHALTLGLGLARIGQAAADAAVRLALRREGGNNARAARRLGISPRALQLRRKPRGELADGAANGNTDAHAQTDTAGKSTACAPPRDGDLPA